MKKLMINTRVLAIALLSTFTVAFASPAMANDDKKSIPVEMRLISNVNNQPLFAMTINTPEATAFTITIRDEFGNELYRDQVKGSFTKKFLLNTEELNGAALTFEVTGDKTHKRAIFEINKYTRMVEDIVVNKLK